jgi:hypothetical protein
MKAKSFNDMSYNEKIAFMNSFLDELKGEEWDRFLIDTEYELYKDITCPFLNEEFSLVDRYNAEMSIGGMDLSLTDESEMIHKFTYDHKFGLQSENQAADNYGYKLAA